MTDEEIIKKAGAKWSRTRGTMDSYLKLIIQYAREDERDRVLLEGLQGGFNNLENGYGNKQSNDLASKKRNP